MVNKNKNLSAFAAEPLDKQIIVSSNYGEMSESLKLDAKEFQAPFDEANRKMMDGFSITPVADSENQIIGKNYMVNNFRINSDISIYLWIYFPDAPYDNFYKLNISFSNNDGKKIEWEFDYKELSTLMGLSLQSGWKLIELVYNDSKKSFTDNSEVNLNLMQITYKKSDKLPTTEDGSLIKSTTTDKLTFFNVYASAKTPDGINDITKSSVKKSLNYSYYSFKASFINQFKNVYLDSYYSLRGKKISDIFSYVYVGKTNILLGGAANNRFTWNITVKPRNEQAYDVGFNDTIFFDTLGTCRITFKLEEQKQNQSKSSVIFNAVNEVIVKQFAFGHFSENEYSLKQGKEIIIVFTLADDYETEGLVTFTSENEKIAKITKVVYETETRTYYVSIKAEKKGEINITASSSGKKLSSSSLSGTDNEAENVSVFSENISVKITSDGINQWMIYVLYGILGCFGLAFVIFLIISFASARKNIVK